MHQIEELQPADEEQALAFAVERSLSHSTEQPDTSNAEKAVQQAVEVSVRVRETCHI